MFGLRLSRTRWRRRQLWRQPFHLFTAGHSSIGSPLHLLDRVCVDCWSEKDARRTMARDPTRCEASRRDQKMLAEGVFEVGRS